MGPWECCVVMGPYSQHLWAFFACTKREEFTAVRVQTRRGLWFVDRYGENTWTVNFFGWLHVDCNS